MFVLQHVFKVFCFCLNDVCFIFYIHVFVEILSDFLICDVVHKKKRTSVLYNIFFGSYLSRCFGIGGF